MELIGELGSNNSSKIVMLPIASKNVFIKFVDQCIKIVNIKEKLNGLKVSTKMQNRK